MKRERKKEWEAQRRRRRRSGNWGFLSEEAAGWGGQRQKKKKEKLSAVCVCVLSEPSGPGGWRAYAGAAARVCMCQRRWGHSRLLTQETSAVTGVGVKKEWPFLGLFSCVSRLDWTRARLTSRLTRCTASCFDKSCLTLIWIQQSLYFETGKCFDYFNLIIPGVNRLETRQVVYYSLA